jgi:alkylation response protein AidB-like acyl-CoA dehydrogenase
MDLNFAPEDLAFRDTVRAWLAENLPADLQRKVLNHQRLKRDDYVRWHRIVHRQGWVAPNWPVEHGGPGWSRVQQHIWEEECARAGTPPILPFGVNMVAPVIIAFGNEAQKRHYLPRILSCDDWWCQGYSEPGSGSDLASLKTRAVRDGDHYVVNGQKTWTTLGQHADMMFCLVRTDPDARKQEGISFLLIDMKTPGITVRPIITLGGEHEVNEVWLEDVIVPVENRIYEENKGWSVAKYLLGNERTGIARLGKSKERVRFAKEVARDVRMNGKPLIEDKAFRQRVAQLEVDMKALEITQLRVISAYAKAGGNRPDPLSSVLKIKGTELLQGTSELVMDVGGPEAMPVWQKELSALSNEPAMGPEWAPQMAPAYLMLRAASIYGGTNEIQKNILNKAVLGL